MSDVFGYAHVDIGFFGDGNDGITSIGGSSTLTRSMFYEELEVAGGGTLNTGGYKIFCRELFECKGTIQNNGGNGANGSGVAGGSGGAGPSANEVGRTAKAPDGVTGDLNAGAPSSIVFTGVRGGGGNGGAAGKGGNGTGGSGGTATAGEVITPAYIYFWDGHPMFGAALDATGGRGNGGSSGGGDLINGGGGGGGGGGFGGEVWIAAKNFYNSGTIQANGGNGGNGANAAAGNCGGGGGAGGGGGGVVQYYYIANLEGGGTFAVNGGAGGTGGNGVGTGTAGGNGSAGASGKILKIQVRL